MVNATDGVEHGKYRVLPEGFTECCERPTLDHVLADNWQDDPMNPAVCWRPKSPAEIDAEQDAETQSRFKDELANDKLISVIYNIDERLRVLESRNAIDKPTFWNGLKNFLRNNTFFDF